MKEVECNEECFEKTGGLVRVDLEEADETVNTGGRKTVPEDVAGGELHDCCFEGADGLSAES